MKQVNRKIHIWFFIIFLSSAYGISQIPERPVILGISGATFSVNEIEKAEKYYTQVLDLQKIQLHDENISKAKTITLAVNYRQWLEFTENNDMDGSEPRLIKYTLEISSIASLKKYLDYHNILYINSSGSNNHNSIIIKRPNNLSLEFREVNTSIYSKKKSDKSSNMVKNIHHIGIYVADVSEEDMFYKTIFGFKEIWRYNDDLTSKPNFVYLRMPDCTENIEYNITNNPYSAHVCFSVSNMQDFLYNLRERTSKDVRYKPIIGKGRRWLLNTKDPEGLRIEFTEPFVVK
jgi:catechol 2,3-dioxygenase-like lactoylglutathione lyase family enzyme